MMSRIAKYFLYLVFLNGLLTTLLISFWKEIFEDSRPMIGIALSMTIFLFYELFVIMFTESKGETLNSRQSVNLFLGFKAGKIVLSLFIIAVYAIVVKIELKPFVGVFVALYFIYLLFDTLYLFNREKSFKKKQYKNKEIERLSNYYKNKE